MRQTRVNTCGPPRRNTFDAKGASREMGGALVAASEEGQRHRLRKSSKEHHDHDELKLLRPASAAPSSDERSCGRILVDAPRCAEITRPGSIDGRPLQRLELYVAAEETRGSAWSYFAAAFTPPSPPPRQLATTRRRRSRD
jgi:hypothetical protein